MAEVKAHRQRVAVVTGAGGGIGAAIAEELARQGTFVVTVDPLVSVAGAERLPAPEETTVGRIEAAGGSARASSASVTDRDAIHALFAEVGGLDVVVNVAGITRPTSYTRGTEDDWRSVLSVHLDGYRNVLDAALPLMADAGRGHVLGVTSGSGWRPADTGAYGCAKRAVASLTWQLGSHAPPGVVVNALSPIAMTRMVTAALGRRKPAESSGSGPTSSSTGGLSLGSMPTPAELGPLAAHLVAETFDSCHGQVLFSAGTEMASVEEPRLLEVLGSEDFATLAHALEVVTPDALAPAERHQESKGGTNPRFAASFDQLGTAALPRSEVQSCLVISDRPEVTDAVVAALGVRGVACRHEDPGLSADGFAGAAGLLTSADEHDGPSTEWCSPWRGGRRVRARPASGSASWPSTTASSTRSTPMQRGLVRSPTSPRGPIGRFGWSRSPTGVRAAGGVGHRPRHNCPAPRSVRPTVEWWRSLSASRRPRSP